MAATERHILVTGFEPFGGDTANPAQELAKALAGRAVGDCAVRGLVLPVQHEAAREAVAPALEADGLAAVVHLGLAGGRARLSLERVAVNVMDYALPDARGDVLRDTACVPDGPAAHLSTLPLRAILTELTAGGIPAHLSYTAGTYLCNYTLYTTLHALAGRGRAVPAGFIHLPFLPSMVAAHALEEPSMDLGLMTRALEVVLRVLAPTRESPPAM
jgi:pyroglutamyl-peptidase